LADPRPGSSDQVMAKVGRVTKGKRPTLLETTKANEVIDAINILHNVTIEKGSQDEVIISPQGVEIYYDGNSNAPTGSGVDAIIESISLDGSSGVEIGVEDGIIQNVISRTPSLGTGGTFRLIDAFDFSRCKEFVLQNGLVKSVSEFPSQFSGTTQFLELLDPTDPTRLVRLVIREGVISSITATPSKYELQSVEVCVDGVNTTKNFLAYDANNPNAQPIDPGSVLNIIYTKTETDALFIRIPDGDARYSMKVDTYTKQESDARFAPLQSTQNQLGTINDFIQSFTQNLS